MSPDALSVGLQALRFLCLFQAAGTALFLILFAGRVPRSERLIRRLGCWSALAGATLIAAHQLLEAARLAGDYSGLADSRLQMLALMSSGGHAHLLQWLALSLIAAGLARATRAGLWLAGIGAALVVISFALTGHTSVHALRWLLAPLLCLHLAIVTFWFGALLPLLVTIRRESPADAQRVFGRFSAFATWLVPIIAVAGFAMALLLIPDMSVLLQPYGQLLGLKFALFCVLMIPAALNKWRFVPALAGGDASRGAAVLRRSVLLEYALIVVVLGVTAALTAFYSPES